MEKEKEIWYQWQPLSILTTTGWVPSKQGRLLYLTAIRLWVSLGEEGRTSCPFPSEEGTSDRLGQFFRKGKARSFLYQHWQQLGDLHHSGKGVWVRTTAFTLLPYLCVYVLRYLQIIYATPCPPYLDLTPFFWNRGKPVPGFPPLSEVITNFLRIYR